MLKRLVILFLCMSMIVSMFPVQIFAADDVTESAEQTQEAESSEQTAEFSESGEEDLASSETEISEVTEEFEVILEEEDFMTNEERFEGYVNQLFFEDSSAAPFAIGRESAGARLSGDDKLAYDALVPVIRQIADGQRSSTEIKLGTTDDADVYVDFSDACYLLDISAIRNALRMDCPYELYWYNPYLYGSGVTGGKDWITITFLVDETYRGSSIFEVNTSKTRAAKTAAQNAKAIVKKYDGQTDYQKLLGYKNEILQLVDYDDYSAAHGASAGVGAWSVVNTFDGDPKTNIVCGGYAFSYQYLCDMSGLTCYYVLGGFDRNSAVIAGHAWNVVTLEGNNYLVDVCNLDEGTWGSQDQSLFLAGGRGSVETGYTITNSWGAEITFVYYPPDIEHWGKEVLTLAPRSYKPCTHAYNSGLVTKAPTEESTGIRTYTCTKCGNAYTETIAKLPHTHKYTAKVTAPTCLDKGYTTYTCKCGDSYLSEYKDAKGHSEASDPAVKATCYSTGLTAGSHCSTCGEILKKQYELPRVEHYIIGDECFYCGRIGNSCGEHLTWVFDEHTGVLTIEGYGEMDAGYNWMAYEDEIIKVVLPEKLTSICDLAFADCINLTDIRIPENVTSVGQYAFSGCESLETIDLPDGVARIGEGAFSDCNAITEFTVPRNVKTIPQNAFTRSENLKTVNLPQDLEEIAPYAFYNCRGLESIVIPETVEKIGECAFMDCRAMTSVQMPQKMTELGDSVFDGCTALKAVALPSGIETIGESMFLWCFDLQQVSIPEGVTCIETHAFAGCSSLEELVLPGSLQILEKSAIRACRGLKSLVIPEGITTLEEETFYACSSLREITIPAGVTAIGSGVFGACTDLESITFLGDPPAFDPNAFSELTTTIHYPGDLKWTPDLLQDYGGTITWEPKHNYIASSVPATCTEVGYTIFTCTDCGHSFRQDEKEPAGHLMGVWVVTKEMTDTELGEERRSCLNCGLTESRVIGKNLPGDADGDFVLTQQDALYLLWHCAFEDDYPLNCDGDLTGDRAVTEEDAMYLLWHTLFPTMYPLK